MSKKLRESQVLSRQNDIVDLSNASINPTWRQVYNLNNKWREQNLGNCINPFEKLKEKMQLYEDAGNDNYSIKVTSI